MQETAQTVPGFGEGKLVYSEADELVPATGTDPDAQKFMNERNTML